MKTGWLSDPRYLEHLTGRGHPERPDRLVAISRAIEQAGLLERLVPIKARPAAMDDVLAVHEIGYVKRLEDACQDGAPFIDVPDSAICPASYEIALLAAGGVLAACDAAMSGQIDNAFCAVRPPGHHCYADRSMGFCLLNNNAIAARYLLRHHHLTRVLILDWDVHHGNGTQSIFERDGWVFVCSMHEHPTFLYPGTGYAWEEGEGPGQGRIMNLPMMPRAGDEEYRQAFLTKFLPAARNFNPDFILVSAGFDAHQNDPLATMGLTQAGFDWMVRQTKRLARQCCGGRLVSMLEGGYDLDALSSCVVSHVKILMEDEEPSETDFP